MKCLRPFPTRFGEVGCGQCLPCRINRRRLWTSRIVLESYCHPENAFVTLTYADDKLPLDDKQRPVLRRQDCTDFFKRVRKAGVRFRYFGCGEYGDQTLRPHYHLALFGVSPFAKDFLEEKWGHGFVHTGELNGRSAHYVAGYCTKKMTAKDDPRLEGRTPEFAMMSRRPGIGFDAILRIGDSITSSYGTSLKVSEEGDVPSTVRIDGKQLPIGKYLRAALRENIGWERSAPDAVKMQHTLRTMLTPLAELKANIARREGHAVQAAAKLKISQSKRQKL